MEKEEIINTLKAKIEERLGRNLSVPSDFNYLILQMQKEKNETLSISTLKRLWGYVRYPHQTSKNTLSCLARYAGYKDWDGFVAANNGNGEVDSNFLSGKQINADMLCKDDEIEFGWEPDRYCRVRCIGNGMFRVLESRNGKLQCGDTFRACAFALGFPLYVTDVCRNGKNLESYIAGRRNGLNYLNKRHNPA